jgi:diacylglycerol kinase family enzyme
MDALAAPDRRAHHAPMIRRRLAALAALALGLAALVLLIVLVALDLGRGILSVALLALSLAVAWQGLVRRGARRVLGLGAGALLATAVVALLISGEPALVLALVAALSLGLAAASDAFHVPVALPRAPRPAHPVLLYNPRSGGGKVSRFRVPDEARARGIAAIELTPGADLEQLVHRALADGADAVAMAGGDGSQAVVAAIAAERGVPYACIPAGTRNHFALDLGLDRDDVVGALDAFTDGVERRVDLATVNGRVFVNNASLGLYAVIVQSPDYRDAKRRTAADMLPDLIGPDAPPLDLRYAGPDGEEHTTAHVILVSNDPYRLDDLGGKGTRERMDLGVLGIVTAHLAGAADAEAFVALNAAGQVRRFHGWREWTTAGFRVDSAAPIHVGVDGEALTLDPPLVFESVPRALRVRLPAHAPGLTRPARRRPASIPSELVRVAAAG